MNVLYNVLYVDRDGVVRFGRLTLRSPEDNDRPPLLLGLGGKVVTPADVLALLAPQQSTADQRKALLRAEAAGFRVENT